MLWRLSGAMNRCRRTGADVGKVFVEWLMVGGADIPVLETLVAPVRAC